MDVTNRHILVVGLARTGVSVARFLASRGARVTVTDLRDEIALAGVMDELGRWISAGCWGGMTRSISPPPT